MLVLMRRVGERLFIDTSEGRITITITETRSTCVRVGIDAPKGMSIVREEIDQGECYVRSEGGVDMVRRHGGKRGDHLKVD